MQGLLTDMCSPEKSLASLTTQHIEGKSDLAVTTHNTIIRLLLSCIVPFILAHVFYVRVWKNIITSM